MREADQPQGTWEAIGRAPIPRCTGVATRPPGTTTSEGGGRRRAQTPTMRQTQVRSIQPTCLSQRPSSETWPQVHRESNDPGDPHQRTMHMACAAIMRHETRGHQGSPTAPKAPWTSPDIPETGCSRPEARMTVLNGKIAGSEHLQGLNPQPSCTCLRRLSARCQDSLLA